MRKKLPTAVEMMRALVALESVSSTDARFDRSNRPMIEQLAEYCEVLGMSVTELPVPGGRDKYNLIATLGDGDGGVVLAGHTDTVAWDADRWSSDPFSLTERAGALYGLGVADMKGFFALVLETLATISPSDLGRPVTLVATADEESTMAGARALSERGELSARVAIVGEPTGLVPVRMHKGILMESVHVIGVPGHSSDPSLGKNAIEGMHRVISALLAHRDLLGLQRHDGFAVPTPTLNLGRVEGGDSPNRIAAACELRFDLRLLPGMDVGVVRREVRDVVARALEGTGLAFRCESLADATPPFETDADADVVRFAEAVTARPSRSVGFCTEAPYFASLGIETIVLGAGEIEVAHQPDEHVRLDALGPARRVYERLVARFAGRDA